MIINIDYIFSYDFSFHIDGPSTDPNDNTIDIIVFIILGASYGLNFLIHLKIIKKSIYPIVVVRNNIYGKNLQQKP